MKRYYQLRFWLNKILPFLLILIFEEAAAQTSIYHPFPDSGIVWREHLLGIGFNCCCQGSVCAHEDDYEYFLDGDTLIGMVAYKKILQTGIGSEYIVGPPICPPGCNGNIQYNYYNNVYSGGLRQDTNQKKVYYLPPSSSQDTLLYDFNLSLGDTLPSTWNNGHSNYISLIDSILIGNNYHKRYWLSIDSSFNYTSIIEGIGSAYGLLYQLLPPFEFSNSLVCVTINSLTVFPDTISDCQFVSSNIEIGNGKQIKFSPNPFHSFTTLEFNSTFENSEMRIFNPLGVQIKIIQLHSTSQIINRDGLLNGIYFFQIRNQKGYSVSGKIIVY